MGSRKGRARALPMRILTGDGARVALQRCPILRAGATDSSTEPQTKRKLPMFCSPIWSGFLIEATNAISSGFLREATGVPRRQANQKLRPTMLKWMRIAPSTQPDSIKS
jgi:hypothetical protein